MANQEKRNDLPFKEGDKIKLVNHFNKDWNNKSGVIIPIILIKIEIIKQELL